MHKKDLQNPKVINHVQSECKYQQLQTQCENQD